jgi:ankyrin repeat protein
VVLELVRRGADVNARNQAGSTPLAAALANGHPDVARVLAEHGAR